MHHPEQYNLMAKSIQKERLRRAAESRKGMKSRPFLSSFRQGLQRLLSYSRLRLFAGPTTDAANKEPRNKTNLSQQRL